MSTQDPNDLRDPRLDAAWRAASNEDPPAALDEAIRAAARREVKAGPQPSGAPVTTVPQALRPERWWMPLAAAATIGAIAIGILQIANPDKVIEPAHDKAIVSDMPPIRRRQVKRRRLLRLRFRLRVTTRAIASRRRHQRHPV